VELKGSKTHESLSAALVRKAVANRLYLYLAKQADNEGRRDLARLFRETADGETLHAFGLLEHIKTVGDPLNGSPMGGWEDYLKNAIEASREEAEKVFPGFAQAARDEGFADIADWFDALAKGETVHADRFQRYKESLYSD